MTRREITQLAQLNGRKVGVLTETGQTSVAARLTIEKAGATATYLPLIRFDLIYAALAAGEIDAGALPIDLRFTGEVRYGWNAFPISEFGTPSIFATTRRLIASDRALVMDVMQGFVEDDPPVQDASRRRRAVAATLFEHRGSNSRRAALRLSCPGISEETAAVVSRDANAAGPARRKISGSGLAESFRYRGFFIHR